MPAPMPSWPTRTPKRDCRCEYVWRPPDRQKEEKKKITGCHTMTDLSCVDMGEVMVAWLGFFPPMVHNHQKKGVMTENKRPVPQRRPPPRAFPASNRPRRGQRYPQIVPRRVLAARRRRNPQQPAADHDNPFTPTPSLPSDSESRELATRYERRRGLDYTRGESPTVTVGWWVRRLS